MGAINKITADNKINGYIANYLGSNIGFARVIAKRCFITCNTCEK